MTMKNQNLRKKCISIDNEEYKGQKGNLCQSGLIRSENIRKAQALQLLNGTIIPKKFKFRQKETEQIENFIHECLKEGYKKHKILMITGSPGAGKTLSANFIIQKQKCKKIKLNANITKTIKQVQQVLCKQLIGRNDGAQLTTIQIIRAIQHEGCQPCILYIEEIEILFNSIPTIYTQGFFSLFVQKKFQIILIGISNTIDSLQNYGNKIYFKTQDIKNIVFKPYSINAIVQILSMKIEQVQNKTGIVLNFSDKLLKHSANKLNNLKKGDLRIALEFLKEIMYEVVYLSKSSQTYTVTIEVISKIFSKMGSQKDALMVTLPFQQQVILLALFTNIKRTDALAVTIKDLIPDVKWICQSIKLTFNRKMIDDGIPDLEQYCMVALTKKKNQSRVTLKVSLNEIQASFGEHLIFKKFFTE